MSRIIIILLLLFPTAVFSQNFIGKNKKQVKKYLQQQITKHDSLSIILTDRDSVLLYAVKAGKVLPADFIYSFDKSGKCRSEKVIANCDSCFNKFLKTTLDKKKYAWKKINENQYVSKYGSRMMIELPAEVNNFSYTILRAEWTKELYTMLTGN